MMTHCPFTKASSSFAQCAKLPGSTSVGDHSLAYLMCITRGSTPGQNAVSQPVNQQLQGSCPTSPKRCLSPPPCPLLTSTNCVYCCLLGSNSFCPQQPCCAVCDSHFPCHQCQPYSAARCIHLYCATWTFTNCSAAPSGSPAVVLFNSLYIIHMTAKAPALC